MGAYIYQNEDIHRPNPQKDHPCAETRRLSHKARKSVKPFDLGAGSRKKGKDRTVQDSLKKSQSGNISPIWGEAPTVPIETKICVERHLADVITCAQFQDEIFRGYDFTGGRISHFSYSLCMSLTTAAIPAVIPDPICLFTIQLSWGYDED